MASWLIAAFTIASEIACLFARKSTTSNSIPSATTHANELSTASTAGATRKFQTTTKRPANAAVMKQSAATTNVACLIQWTVLTEIPAMRSALTIITEMTDRPVSRKGCSQMDNEEPDGPLLLTHHAIAPNIAATTMGDIAADR